MSNIQPIRKLLGISQEALAGVLGLTQGAVGHYETGVVRLPIDAAIKIRDYAAKQGLNLSLDQIYGVKPPGKRAKAAAATEGDAAC